MDYYDPGRLRSYYNAMIKGEANSLHAYAHRMSVEHLRDSHTQFVFISDIDKFIRAHLTQFNLKKDEPAFKACIASLREERSHLEKQHALLNAREAKVVASAELTHQLDTWGYIINGVSVVLGTFQVIAGFGVTAVSGATGNIVGMAAGVLLVIHGFNGIQESLTNLKENRNDTTGFAKKGYIATAEFLGFDPKAGALAYNVMDLSLSVYGVMRQVLKTDVWRLFKYIPSDFVRNYKKMSNTALTIEATGDGLSGYNIWKESK